MWEEFIHTIYDVFYIFQWLFDNLKDLFVLVFKPFTFIFNFGKGFFYSAFATTEQLGIENLPIQNFSTSTFQFFSAIPYVNLVFLGVGAGLGILAGLFLFKKIIHI